MKQCKCELIIQYTELSFYHTPSNTFTWLCVFLYIVQINNLLTFHAFVKGILNVLDDIIAEQIMNREENLILI